MTETPRVSDASFYSLETTPSLIPPPTSEPLIHRQLPAVPSPSATVDEVQVFLSQCFLFLRPSTTQEEAETTAKKLMLGGGGLYVYSADAFKAAVGPDGQAVYDIVHIGYYSYAKSCWPFLRFLQKVFAAVAAANGIYQFYKDPKERTLAVSYVFAGLTTFLSVVYQFTSTERVLRSKIWPEKLKVRNPAAAAAATPWTPW